MSPEEAGRAALESYLSDPFVMLAILLLMGLAALLFTLLLLALMRD